MNLGAIAAALASKRRRGRALAGPFSDANYWASALNTGPNGVGQSFAFIMVATALPGTSDAIILGRVDAATGWYADYRSTGQLNTSWRGLSAVGIAVASVVAGTVYAVATTWTANNIRISVNGAAVLVQAATGPQTASASTTQLQVGRYSVAGFPAATQSTSAFKVWNRVLSDAELQAVTANPSTYTLGTTGDELLDFNVARDAIGSPPTVTTQGSSPLVLTLNGTIPIAFV